MKQIEECAMKSGSGWNRREFVKMAACSSIGAMTLGLPQLARATDKASPRFAYVGFGGKEASREGIAVFDVRGAAWRQTSTVTSQTPSSLALAANERFLYAVNEIDEHQGLPSGTVEAYAIDALDGSLRLLSRQRLSLSATAPRHAAVSPDGRSLVVAVYGGGAYNVLPIRDDGSLGEVAGILKETGSGPHERQRSAHPQMVVFDRAARIVTADLGNDHLNVLKLDATQLSVAGRYPTQAGDGPHQIAFHPNGRLLFVANGLDASVACYGYDAVEGRILGKLDQVATGRSRSPGEVVMAMDPTGKFLYTTHRSLGEGVSIWRIGQGTDLLRRLQVVDEGMPVLHEITMMADGKSLLGLSREQGGVFGWPVANGQMSRGILLARLAAPMSVAVKSL